MGSVARFDAIGPDWAIVANTPLKKWKGTSYEGGNNTPMIAHWPDVIKPKKEYYREPVHLIDIMPTLTDITGAEYPGESKEKNIPPMQGVSLLPVFHGKMHSRKEPLYWQWANSSAIRKGDWKLVRTGLKWELYNMKKDRTENNDLASQFPERVKELGELWDKWWTQHMGSKYKGKSMGKKKK
jgi:arylsulfatase